MKSTGRSKKAGCWKKFSISTFRSNVSQPTIHDKKKEVEMRRESIQRNVLFFCQDNTCLSQIAEASAKHLAPPRTRIFSAGIKPGVIPLHVVQAMQELGISMLG